MPLSIPAILETLVAAKGIQNQFSEHHHHDQILLIKFKTALARNENEQQMWTNIHQLALAKLINKSHTLIILIH